jgi:hypothetical protein
MLINLCFEFQFRYSLDRGRGHFSRAYPRSAFNGLAPRDKGNQNRAEVASAPGQHIFVTNGSFALSA